MSIGPKTNQPDPPLLKVEQMVECKVCRELIRGGAEICTNCNQYQNWTRHLVRWGVIIGAVVAVISLYNAASSLSKLIPRPAKFSAIAQLQQNSQLDLAVANLGDHPLLVRSVAIKLSPEDDDGKLLTKIKGEALVAPRKTNMIVYKMVISGTEAPFPSRAKNAKTGGYNLIVSTVDFENNAERKEVECHVR